MGGISESKMKKVTKHVAKSQVYEALDDWLKHKDIFKFAKDIIELVSILSSETILSILDILEAEDRYDAMKRDFDILEANREETSHEIHE